MIARIRKALRDKESGFTLVELLVVVIIIGILAAIAIPLYMNQKQRGYDATVKSDLKNAVTSFETYLTANSTYPANQTVVDSSADWSFNKSSGNTITAHVVVSGSDAGYVVVGKNANSENYYYISSYEGSTPTSAGTTAPTIAAGSNGVPAGVTLVTLNL